MSDADNLVPPHSVEAEQALLGAIFLDNATIKDSRKIVPDPSMFHRDAHQHIYKAMLTLGEKGVKSTDWITVAAQLSKDGRLDDAGGEAYLEKITDATPVAEGAEQYAEIVRDKWVLRRAILVASSARAAAHDPTISTQEIRQAMSDALSEIDRAIASGTPKPSNQQITDEAEAYLCSLADPDSQDTLIAGHPVIDEEAGGFNLGGISQIVGPSGGGKTFFAHQLMNRMYTLFGTKCGMVQGEMKPPQLLVRQSAGIKGMKAMHAIRKARVSGREPTALEKQQANTAISQVRAMGQKLYLVERPETMELHNVAETIRSMAERGAKFLIVDYLQRVTTGKRDANESLKTVVHTIKDLAIGLNVHICCISQIIVSSARDKDKTPWDMSMWDSYGGGNAVNDFDLITTVFRPGILDDTKGKGLRGLMGEQAKGFVATKITKARFGEANHIAFWCNILQEEGLTLDPMPDNILEAVKSICQLWSEDERPQKDVQD
jgi:replicative DNA helicase